MSLNNTKKHRKSLVITKKVPSMTPRSKHSLSPTKQSYQQKRSKPHTPKTTRAKVRKTTVVVSKPSPVLKVTVKNDVQEASKVRATRARKMMVNESVKVTEKTRTRNNKNQKKTEVPIDKNPVKKGRKLNNNEGEEIEDTTYKKQENIPSKATRQTRRNKRNSTVNISKGSSIIVITQKDNKIEPASKRQAVETQKPTQLRNRKGNSRNLKSDRTPQIKENLQKDANEEPGQIQSPVKTRNQRTKNVMEVNDNAKGKRPLRHQKTIDEPRADLTARNQRNKDITKADTDVNDNTTSKRRKLQKTISNESKMKIGAKTRNKRNKVTTKSDSEVNDIMTAERQKTLRKAISNESKTNFEPKTRNRRNKDAVEITEVNETKLRRQIRFNKAVSDESKTELQAKTRRRNKDLMGTDNVENSKSRVQNITENKSSETRSKSKQDSEGRKRKTVTEEISPAKMKRTKNKSIEVMEKATNVRTKRGRNQSKIEDKRTNVTAVATRKGRGGTVSCNFCFLYKFSFFYSKCSKFTSYSMYIYVHLI